MPSSFEIMLRIKQKQQNENYWGVLKRFLVGVVELQKFEGMYDQRRGGFLNYRSMESSLNSYQYQIIAQTKLINQLKFRVASLESVISDQKRQVEYFHSIESQADFKVKGTPFAMGRTELDQLSLRNCKMEVQITKVMVAKGKGNVDGTNSVQEFGQANQVKELSNNSGVLQLVLKKQIQIFLSVLYFGGPTCQRENESLPKLAQEDNSDMYQEEKKNQSGIKINSASVALTFQKQIENYDSNVNVVVNKIVKAWPALDNFQLQSINEKSKKSGESSFAKRKKGEKGEDQNRERCVDVCGFEVDEQTDFFGGRSINLSQLGWIRKCRLILGRERI